MLDLSGKHILLGLTGSIACYKSADLLRKLTENGATVDVIMTESSTQFITPITMQSLSKRAVFASNNTVKNMEHIWLTRECNAILIAPASANFLAKLAHGIADDFLSTLCLARSCPLLVTPAMNKEMWLNRRTQHNIEILLNDNIKVLGPSFGKQACEEIGDGRMLEPEEILDSLIIFFQPKLLLGCNVLVTAGPTSEHIDPIRVLSNRSSGKTGYSIARAANEAGAIVTMITGKTALKYPYGVIVHKVETAAQMHNAVMSHIEKTDIFISTAAISDWKVMNYSSNKLKKDLLPKIRFEPTIDVLKEVANLKSAPWCVGFAAETENLEKYAEAKRLSKGVPLFVGNLAKHMDSDETELTLFDSQGIHQLHPANKLNAARQLIREIAIRFNRKHIPEEIFNE